MNDFNLNRVALMIVKGEKVPYYDLPYVDAVNTVMDEVLAAWNNGLLVAVRGEEFNGEYFATVHTMTEEEVIDYYNNGGVWSYI